MIPLGRRWKSYSLPSTTTVCPALFPPCRFNQGTWRLDHNIVHCNTNKMRLRWATLFQIQMFTCSALTGCLWPSHISSWRMWPLSCPVGGALKPQHTGCSGLSQTAQQQLLAGWTSIYVSWRRHLWGSFFNIEILLVTVFSMIQCCGFGAFNKEIQLSCCIWCSKPNLTFSIL